MSAPVYRWRRERAAWLAPGDIVDFGHGSFARVASVDARCSDPEAPAGALPDLVAVAYVGARPDDVFDADLRFEFLRPDDPPPEVPS